MAKAGNSGFEDRWLERYENEKARAEKAPQWQAFRVIPAPSGIGKISVYSQAYSQSGNRKYILSRRSDPL